MTSEKKEDKFVCMGCKGCFYIEGFFVEHLKVCNNEVSKQLRKWGLF